MSNSIRTPALLALTLLSPALFAGCAWMGAPRPSETFSKEWEVREEGRTRVQGALFLTDEGSWGFRGEDSFSPDLEVGEAALLKLESGHHVFSVVEVTRRGYRLRRLDDGALSAGSSRATIAPLTADEAQAHSGVCLLPAGGSVHEACAASHHRHRRWLLYDLTAESGVIADAPLRLTDEARGRRSGMTGADPLSSWLDGAPQPGALLAVEMAPSTGATLHARVAVDPSCPSLTSPSPGVTFFSAPLPRLAHSDHPLVTEAQAAEVGADALITCRGERAFLHTATLTRPLLHDANGRPVGATSLGLKARPIPLKDLVALQSWAASAAFIAVGDFSRGAFWLNDALHHSGERPPEEITLAALAALVAGGQPEAAVSAGHYLTRRAWNRENIPDYLEAKILLYSAFGMADAQRDALEHRADLARRVRDPHRSAWYQWIATRTQLSRHMGTTASTFEPLIEEMEDADEDAWTLAIWFTLRLQGAALPLIDDPAVLLPRFAEQRAENLWAELIGDWESACNDDCVATTYGLRPGSSSESSRQDLAFVARIPGWPGYSAERLHELAAPLEAGAPRTHFWLAAAPLAPSQDSNDVTDALVESLRDTFAHGAAEACEDPAAWKARFSTSAARADAFSLQRSRRDWVHFLSWWEERGVDALCQGPESFTTALELRRRDDNRWFPSALPLLEDLLLRPTTDDGLDAALLRRAVELARAFGDRDTCGIWSLGITVGIARAGYLDAADEHLTAATNCIDDNSELRRARNLVAGYVDFERSAGRPLARDGAVINALDVVARRVPEAGECAGLLPIGFYLEEVLPSRVIRIADRIHLPPAPPDSFRLATASDLLDEAQASYLAGLRDLQRGQLRSAARSLDHARAYFVRIDHLPGRARVAFLDQTLFLGEMEALANDEVLSDTEFAPSIEAIRRGEIHTLDIDSMTLRDDSADALAATAALLIERRYEDLRERLGDWAPASLCPP